MTTESKKIEFNREYLDLVKDLTRITPSIIFTKDGGFIKIIRVDKNKTMPFKLTVPEEFFLFDGDVLAFANFGDFYQMIDVFGPSSLIQKENKIIINSQSGKINYVLSTPASLMKSPSDINFKDPDVVFNLSSQNLGELNKAYSLLKGDLAHLFFNGQEIMLRLCGSKHENSFDKIFFPEKVVQGTQNFDFAILAETITKLPANDNYKIAIKKEGYVSFEFERNSMIFMAATGKAKKQDQETVNA